MNIGIDHGYYAIKTRHFSFPAGITAYPSSRTVSTTWASGQRKAIWFRFMLEP